MAEYSLSSYSKGLDNKTRNLIILLVLLVISVVVIFFVNRKLAGIKEEHVKKQEELQKDLDDMEKEIARLPGVEKSLEAVREKVFLTNKKMYNQDNPSLTLDYLFDLIEEYNTYLKFDFAVSGRSTSEKDKNVQTILYSLSGDAYINMFYPFLDQLERQPSFYTVESVDLSQYEEEGDIGMVRFGIRLRSYYAEDGISIDNKKIEDYDKRKVRYNPFYPRIHSTIYPSDNAEFDKLIDAEAAELIAISKEGIYVKYNGIRFLKVGDEVKFGELDRIDWEDHEAVFRINKYGVSEYITKELPKK